MSKEVEYYRHTEGRTGAGQVVRFTCAPEQEQQVRSLLALVGKVDIPSARCVNVSHGGYGMYSRYPIVQHKYAGGGPGESGGWGFIEVLEIQDPPDGRCGIVINECTSHSGMVFTEWKTLKNALAAFERSWGSEARRKELPKLPGFIRQVVCGALTPWFYAVGDQELVGDFVFPVDLQNHPMYRYGRRFVVNDGNGDEFPVIKTCVGSRIIEEKSGHYPYTTSVRRVIFWDDGTWWEGGEHTYVSSDRFARPLADSEHWIDEAIREFHELLAGRSTKFEIPFVAGGKFVGRVVSAKGKRQSAEGIYYAVVHLKGENKSRRGEFDFKPTPEIPDVVSFLKSKFQREGQSRIKRLQVEKRKTTQKGKKWAGVFYDGPP